MVCADRFLTGPFSYEGTKFQCLVVVEHAIKTSYGSMVVTQKASIRQFIISWLSSIHVTKQDTTLGPEVYSDPVHIRNKVSTAMVLLGFSSSSSASCRVHSWLYRVVSLGPSSYIRMLVHQR